MSKLAISAMGYLLFSASSVADDVKINAMGRPSEPPTTIGSSYSSGFYAGKDTYGMRSNAVVAAFKANSGKPFDFPVLGFQYVKALGHYSDRDSVGLYADNTSPPFKSWERVNKTVFSPTSVSSSEIDHTKIKSGMIVDTDSSPKWSSYVVSVSKGKIVTAGWVNSGSKKMGTPENGTSLIINPITKVWATNFNTFLPADGRANNGVIQENGMVNNKTENPIVVNGIDTVVLPQSKFGGTAAYLARGANVGNKQRWHFGFMSQGNVVNFSSSESNAHSPSVGFLENSRALNGLVFNGKNKESSIVWRDGDRVVASIDPKGLISKLGYKTVVIKNDSALSDNVGRYIVSTDKNITLKLPKKQNVFAGYTLKITKVSGKGGVFIESIDSKVNGGDLYKLSGDTWNKEAIYDGNYWYVY